MTLDAWSKYVEWALEMVPPTSTELRVLKTDAFNEAKDKTPSQAGFVRRAIAPELMHANLTCIEIDPVRVKEAQQRYPWLHVIEGDILSLPFGNAEFDVVLDFSTIDHVADFRTVLKEYHRVLEPGGRALIVAWLAEKQRLLNNQFVFRDVDFISAIRKYFVITSLEGYSDVHGKVTQDLLVKFVLSRKGA